MAYLRLYKNANYYIASSMDSLDLRYSKSVLLKIYEKGGSVIQSDLKLIASNWRTLTDVISSLGNDGYLDITEKISGRRITRIALTEKGRIVAENLMHLEEPRVTIPEGLIAEIEKIIERDKSHSSVEEYVREAVRKALEKWKKEHAVG